MRKFFVFLLLSLMVIPVAVSAQQFREERVYYTVKQGDSLRAIANMYGTTVPELYRLNPTLRDINRVSPGTRVMFIDRKGVEARKRNATTGRSQLTAQRAQPASRVAAEPRFTGGDESPASTSESGRKPMYVAVRGFGMLSTDINAMEIAPFGYGGAFDYNAQINNWFGITFSIDAGYVGGNNRGVDASSVNIGARAFFVFQPIMPVEASGVQPYIGVGPSYTVSIQDVYENAASNCNITKHRLGVAATAGINYVYKNFIFGVDLEYNFVQPQSTDDTIIHMDMASGFTAGLRFGYRF